MVKVRRLVIDLLKPNDPEILDFVTDIASLEGVDSVNGVLLETDREVQNIKLTIEGQDLDFQQIQENIDTLGGAIHSVDEVVAGEELITESRTPQDV
ncbi:MAG: DUF211 domain-containing protein [Halobacteriaceae archaeon]